MGVEGVNVEGMKVVEGVVEAGVEEERVNVGGTEQESGVYRWWERW